MTIGVVVFLPRILFPSGEKLVNMRPGSAHAPGVKVNFSAIPWTRKEQVQFCRLKSLFFGRSAGLGLGFFFGLRFLLSHLDDIPKGNVMKVVLENL
jgi:hypothetical protein